MNLYYNENNKRKYIEYNEQYDIENIYSELDNLIKKIKTIQEAKDKLFSLNFNELKCNKENKKIYYRKSKIKIPFYEHLEYNNKLLYDYYVLIRQQYIPMQVKAYMLNKYERPLFKIGIPYDVVRFILRFLVV